MAIRSQSLVILGTNLFLSQVSRSPLFHQSCVRGVHFHLRLRAVGSRYKFTCSRQLRVAAGRRRPRIHSANSANGRRPKSQSEMERKERFPVIDHKVWILRLAHENSYLSWSRNAAICAGVAATVRMVEGEFGPPSTFITGFADLGMVFIAYGSCHHLYQAFRLRKALQLTRPEFLWVCAYTTAIGFVYYMLIHSKFNVLSNW